MTGPARAADAGELARARRQFIRDHHPDRGGDARTFTAGLEAFDTAWTDAHRVVRVTAVHRPRGLRRLIEPVQKRLRRRRHPRVH